MAHSPLRWAWGAAIDSVPTRFAKVASPAALDLVCALAARFVEQHGAYAEAAGMQPAHLLSFDPHRLERRGLAWRMEPLTVVQGFPCKGRLITEYQEDRTGYRGRPMVYAFMRRGGLKMLFGSERTAVLDAPWDLSLKPALNGSSVNGHNTRLPGLGGEDWHG